ncbi:MAG: hypothetical protein ACREQK_01975 [Candidatus Binatia bacterium]
MFLWGNVTPVLAQHVICCNQLIDVSGNWIGARDPGRRYSTALLPGAALRG